MESEVNKMKLCLVCSAIAHTCNFGAVTCESCKAFFRRNANRDDVMKRCQRNCEISYKTRSKCRSCRLKRCFEKGMNKSMILSEEEKEKRNLKIGHNRVKKDIVSLTRRNHLMTAKKNPDIGTNKTQGKEEVAGPLSSFQEVFLKSLKQRYKLDYQGNEISSSEVNMVRNMPINSFEEITEGGLHSNIFWYDDSVDVETAEVNLLPEFGTEPDITNCQANIDTLQANIATSSQDLYNLHTDNNIDHFDDVYHTQNNASLSQEISTQLEKELSKSKNSSVLTAHRVDDDISGVVITIPDSHDHHNVSSDHEPSNQLSNILQPSVDISDETLGMLSNASMSDTSFTPTKDYLDNILLDDTSQVVKKNVYSNPDDEGVPSIDEGVPSIVSIQPFNGFPSEVPYHCNEFFSVQQENNGLLEQVMNDVFCNSNVWDTPVSSSLSTNLDSSPVDMMTTVTNNDTEYSDFIPILDETFPENLKSSLSRQQINDCASYLHTTVIPEADTLSMCTLKGSENRTNVDNTQEIPIIAHEEVCCDIPDTSTIQHELSSNLHDNCAPNLYSANLDQINHNDTPLNLTASSEISSSSDISDFEDDEAEKGFCMEDFDDFLDKYFLADSPETTESSVVDERECQSIIFSQGVQQHIIENMKPEFGAILNELKAAFAESFDKPPPQDIKEPAEAIAFFNQFGVIINQVIQFAKGITAFQNLDQADQITLVKGSFVHLLGMRLLGDFNEKSKCFEVRHLQSDENVTVTKIRTLVVLTNYDIGKKLLNFFFKFAKEFSNATNRDPGIMMCLCGYLLFSVRSKSSYNNKDHIQHWCELYLKTLANYIEVAYPGGEIKLSNILREIKDVGKTSRLFQKALDGLDVNQLSPVLLELFSI